MELAQSREMYPMDGNSSDEDNAPEGNAPKATNVATGPQAQRTKVNHILKLQQQHATLYELLDVNASATKVNIINAWKRIVGGIHPDKNKDSAAKRCTQAVNNAKDVLTDPQRRLIYNNFILKNPPPPTTETFDEEFDAGAFDNTGSDDEAFERDDEDSEGNIEASYPLPNRRITQLHSRITPHIGIWFRDVDSTINPQLLSKIDQINNKIRKVTEKNKELVPAIYEVPRQKLIMLQYTQRSILMGFETQQSNIEKLQRETLGLRNYFTRTCQRGLHHWPIDWVQLLMEPLHRKLEILGVPRERQMPPGTDSGAALSAGNDEDIETDIEMEDVDDVDEDVKGTHCRQNTRALLRPGFTVNGDPILGYLPTVVSGHLRLTSSRMFVRVDGVNPIKLESGMAVGLDAASAYHNLPEDKKNNIQNTAAICSTMCPSRFVDIVGVTKAPRSKDSTSSRTTYIWVDTNPCSDKPVIVSKTVFRKWLGVGPADQYIDDWLETRRLNSDPRDPEYLQLIHSPTGESSTDNPMSCIQTRGKQLNSSSDDSRIEEMSRKFDRIADLLAKGQEEARENRELNRELLNRLFPSSTRGPS